LGNGSHLGYMIGTVHGRSKAQCRRGPMRVPKASIIRVVGYVLDHVKHVIIGNNG